MPYPGLDLLAAGLQPIFCSLTCKDDNSQFKHESLLAKMTIHDSKKSAPQPKSGRQHFCA
eukprot:1157711-Pelagomonas_calceolata.AAC.9